MIMQSFRLAQSDQVQAAIREFNHDGLDLVYLQTPTGFNVLYKFLVVVKVAFWGTQPAIRIESVKLGATTLFVGSDAVQLAGELIMLLVKVHNA